MKTHWIILLGLSAFAVSATHAEKVWSDNLSGSKVWKTESDFQPKIVNSKGRKVMLLNSWDKQGEGLVGAMRLARSTDVILEADKMYTFSILLKSNQPKKPQPVSVTLYDAANPERELSHVRWMPSLQFERYEVEINTAEEPIAAGRRLGVRFETAQWSNQAVAEMQLTVRSLMDRAPGQTLVSNSFLIPVARWKHKYSSSNQGWIERHEDIKRQASKGEAELIFIGDSITHGWESGGIDLWNTYYAPLKAINMGFGGDRVENVLWRLKNGEVDGIFPKVAVLMIGTNNAGSERPDDVAEAINEICSILHEKLPETRILLLAVFPRNTPQDPRHLNNLKMNEMISKLGNNEWVDFLDIAKAFTDENGVVKKELMNDLVHPTTEGYQAWAEAINFAIPPGNSVPVGLLLN